ncbi:pyridine nucleotide-disulfide oxidoreductase [Acidianus sulfidivorans JP7]|uniref:Pyridine nucleotide-disulfide oxidoreductase n=1 Tax=Acidianus sulfidivorans JP7 TaxID=619593 RepID=A0A2U9IQN7_9CREN|nr:FAD-dependent oxidoreductase [Acidianus sulfidivorans]AWR98335.1 pyridine nucleotide-disulfide oxidoreductase [Acidianus sulfidivorans JP7]
MRTVILGGGFAGLSAYKTYSNSILVDDKDYFVLTHKLVDVVRLGDPKVAKIPYKNVFKATVKNIDFKNKKVVTSEGEIAYDKLIIALGYKQKLFPNTEKIENIEDALTLREKIMNAKKVAIIGGGPLGVELASVSLHLGKKKEKVYLIEGQDRLLSFMNYKTSNYALNKLQELGVDVLLKTKVDSISQGEIYTSEGKIEADVIISSIGFQGPSIISELGLSNVNNRMIVNDYLQSVDYEDVYGAGDSATTKRFIPMSAQVAVQAGRRAMLNATGSEEKFNFRQYAIIIRIGDDYFGDLLGKFVQGKIAKLAEEYGIHRAVKLLQ